MGKRRKKDKQARKRANPAWEDIVKENALMETYYKNQHIVPDDEWETFMKYCRKDLPSTFRITKIRGHAKDLLRSLRDGYISKITAEDVKVSKETPQDSTNDDNEESEQDLLLEPIKWYPNELAWNSNLSRRFIRRSEILQKLHRFLVEDSECGAITRQEAVSMIPPMLLDVKPHHLVLDMCAAPGSKTAQIIEMMHDNDQNELPTGAVIANDADHRRCYLLTHQANRLNTPCVIVVNHDATIFPKLYAKNRDIGGDILEFDRVLCDVPCSGDGTIRKNPQMWTKWTPHLGVSLHRLQIKILIRGLELLKVGGRLAYSTCSFNPIENEAVLATVVSRSEGTVHLVDCSNEIPGLERRPGMTTWKVFGRNGKEYKDIEAVDCKPTDGYKESMFPPSEEDAKLLNLKHCVRIFPHLQNTGGFFIAIIQKTADLPWQKAKRARYARYGKHLPWEINDNGNECKDIDDSALVKEECNNEPSDNNVSEITGGEINLEETTKVDASDRVESTAKRGAESSPPKKKFRRGMIREDPYIFLDDTDQELKDVRKFYDISPDLPTHQFLIRSNAGKKRHIYLVSKSIHQILTVNNNLKVINTGVRIVSRSQFKAGFNQHGLEYRLVQDGVHLISRFIKNRIVSITYADLVTLITLGETTIENIKEGTREQLANLDMGSVLWRCTAETFCAEGSPLTSDIWLCGHYGRKIVQCMLSKEEKKHFLRLLGIPIPAEMDVKVKGPGWGDDQNQKKKDDDDPEQSNNGMDVVETEEKLITESALGSETD